jgi:hypothetical protein
MRAIHLLREASAQILYLIAHRREKCCRRLVQHRPAIFRTGIFPGCLNTSQLKGLWNCVRAQRQSVFRLDVIDLTRNQCRRDSPLRNPFEFRRCCDAVSWHSACSGKERGHSFLRPGTQIGLREIRLCSFHSRQQFGKIGNSEVEKQWHISARDWLDRHDEVYGI